MLTSEGHQNTQPTCPRTYLQPSASPDYNLSPTCLPRIRTKEQPDALACVRGREMPRRVEVEGATVSSAGGSGLTSVGCTAVAAALPRAIGTPLWPSAKIAHMNAGAQHAGQFSDPFTLDKGLRVLVTAGASGIGRAISDLLIARAPVSTSAMYRRSFSLSIASRIVTRP